LPHASGAIQQDKHVLCRAMGIILFLISIVIVVIVFIATTTGIVVFDVAQFELARFKFLKYAASKTMSEQKILHNTEH
jgi:hypothetical protein